MGYGNPFPHHAPPPQALPLSQQQQQQQLQSSMTPTPIAPAPASTTTTSTSTRGHLRSSSRHSSLLQQQQSAWSTHSPSSFAGTTAHPIPLAPAPGPAAGPSSPSQQQKPTNDNKVTTKLSKRRESDRLTRAQASNQSTPSASALSTGTVTATATATPSTSTSSGEMQALPQQALPPHLQPAASSAATSSSSSSSTTTTTTEPVAPAVSVEEVPAQAQADPLGRGKRKRPISIARRQSQQYQQQQILPAVIAPAPAPAVAETAGREQQGVSMSEIPVNQSNATATATATAASTTAVATGATADNRKTRTSHRRAFSSSASDAAVQRPIPALRKLKFRLSSVNESASSNSTAPAPAAGAASTTSTSSSHFSVTLPASASANGAPGSSNNKSGTLKSSKSGNNTKQPKSKRQRTQSMSHHTNTTSTFPFNDLRSHLSMQTSLHDATLSNHHHHQHLHPQQHSGALNHDGTLFPLEMHVHHLLSSPGGGLGLNGQHQHVLDLLTSRSAPESNIFSPSSVRNAASGFSFVAGPFSRSHSPSVSLGHSGRRSLPPLENGSGGANANANASSQLQRGEEERDGIDFDGWGGLDDLISGGSSLLNIPLGSSAPASTDFHEAMLKNDIDFAFDFSLDSLNQSSNRLGGGGGGDSEAHHDDHHHEEDDIAEDEASAGEQTRAGSGRSSRQGTAGTRSASVLDRDTRSSSSSFATANEIDGVFDGVDDVDDSRETVKDSSQRRRSSTVKAATRTFAEGDEDSNGSADADHAAADDMVEDQREGEEETANLQSHGNSANNSVNALDDHTLEWAMNTTLCPAAARLVDGQKPSRLLLKRLTSASGLAFPRLSHQQMAHRADTNGPLTPLLRPATISRTNSRDVLTTPVPLAELPSIPLENSHKDSFLFYHLTSEADPPGSPLAGDNSNTHKESERSKTEEDDFDRASASSSASSSSSLLTPVVKAEEDMDEMAEMEESTGDGSSRPQLSRSCSTASGLTAVEAESNDSFNAEMIYRIGGQEEMEQLRGREQILSRSQSSSRTTSLSPRDSFSPQIIGPHEVDADWALTPPSEEEHVDEEEKDLDRATMLGLESVGMDDLDDVWPGARRSMDIQQQVDGVTTDLKVLEVFEPVLSAAPLPASEMPVPAPLVASNNRRDEDSADSDETSMQVDLTPMDEHTAATMFIADESLHPPKPSTEASPDLPSESQQELQQDQSQRPSLSPVSAATEQVTQVTVNTTTTDTSTGTPNSMTTVTVPSTSSPEHALPQPVEPSTQSFLFNPEKPFYPEIAILLTETKILFYSTVHYCVNNGRPLLRRVENDAVDAEALLIALEGSAGDAEAGRLEALDKIRQLSNTWVSLEFARDLLGKYGGIDHPLATFLADDIILSWNEKLVKLGTMLRQKNGLRTPVNKPSSGNTPKTKKTIASKSGNKERPTEAPAESPAATTEAATELESRAESPRQSSVSPSKQQAKQESESLSPGLAKRSLVAKPSKVERAEATKDKISSATASPEPLRAHTFSKSKKHVEVVIEGNASSKKDKNSVAAAMTAAAAAKGVPAARRSSSRHKSITT